MATSFTDAGRKAARSVMSHNAELQKKIEGLRSFGREVVSDPSFVADIVAGVVAPKSPWAWLPGLVMYSSEAGSAEDDARFAKVSKYYREMQAAEAMDQAGRERAALARRNEAIQRERQRLYDKYFSDAELFPEPVNFAGGGIARLAQRMGDKPKHARSLNIVKEPGGNWLTGSIERQVSPLHNRARDIPVVDPNEPRTVAAYSRADAINNWLDKQLTRYIRNEMGTAKDPVRALAERGVLHSDFPNDDLVFTALEARREAGGFPAEGVAVSPLAKRWENVSDAAFSYLTEKAGDLIDPNYYRIGHGDVAAQRLAADPWLAKVPPETKVQHLSTLGDLEFSHLIDELTNAMDPESGLPRELLLKPESMARLSVPQAVERVAKINAWREARKIEADALRANNAATTLFKEYPENNPLGLRWVELKEAEAIGLLNRQERRQQLQDALKYEGDTMGHCVGGYCPDVVEGRSRIYSLRDAKGQPHVTIEVKPRVFSDIFNSLPESDRAEVFKNSPKWASDAQLLETLQKLYPEKVGPLENITQIKGKANRAPNPEYLSFVQDFVRGGNWSEIGDLQNAGMRRTRDVLNELEQKTLREQGHEFGEYLTDVELQELQNMWTTRGDKFAKGGLVKPKTTATTYEETPFEADGLRGLSRKYEQVARYAEGGLVYNPDIVNAMADELRAEVYG